MTRHGKAPDVEVGIVRNLMLDGSCSSEWTHFLVFALRGVRCNLGGGLVEARLALRAAEVVRLAFVGLVGVGFGGGGDFIACH